MKDKEYIMSKLVYYNRQNIDNQQKIRNNRKKVKKIREQKLKDYTYNVTQNPHLNYRWGFLFDINNIFLIIIIFINKN